MAAEAKRESNKMKNERLRCLLKAPWQVAYSEGVVDGAKTNTYRPRRKRPHKRSYRYREHAEPCKPPPAAARKLTIWEQKE